MKSARYFIMACAALTLLLSACKNTATQEDPETEVATGQFNLRMDAKWGNEDFVIEQVYLDTYGNRIRVDQFLSYVSQIFYLLGCLVFLLN